MNLVARIIAVLLVLATGTTYAQSAELARIVNDRFGVQVQESGAFIFVIGEIENHSDYALDTMILEARFYDADGELIDVSTDRLYGITLPPGERVGFRLQSFALAAPEEYVSHDVRMLGADERRPCSGYSGAPAASSADSGVVRKLLITSFPVILLIAAWIFFMRRAGGKDSPQNRTLDLIEEQNAMLKNQSGAIDRIATALEKTDSR
ncbi:MAG: FxLYD domain-containing protein [Pseudomonadota bacterium]